MFAKTFRTNWFAKDCVLIANKIARGWDWKASHFTIAFVYLYWSGESRKNFFFYLIEFLQSILIENLIIISKLFRRDIVTWIISVYDYEISCCFRKNSSSYLCWARSLAFQRAMHIGFILRRSVLICPRWL